MNLKSTLHLALLLLLSFTAKAQIILSGTGDGGFQTGAATFPASGWTVVNEATNKWWVGTVYAPVGTRGAYISQNATGGNNNYNKNNSQVSHFYRDVTFPANATNIQLTFKWRCAGEVDYDYIRVNLAPGGSVPQVGTNPPGTILFDNLADDIGTLTHQESVTLSNALAGTTRTLIFSWINDNSFGSNPGGGVDDINITYTPAAGCTGTPNQGNITASVSNICGSGTSNLTLNGASTGTGITYQWKYFDGSVWQNVGTNSTAYTTPSLTSSTQYQVVTNCATGGSATSPTFTVTVDPAPVVNVSTTDTFICGSGNSVTITASGTAASYTWSPAVGLNTTSGATVIASPTSGKAYTVVGQLGPCSVSKMVSVNVVTPPTLITTATPATICSGGSTQLATTQFVGGNYQVYAIAPYTLTPATEAVALDQSITPPQGDLDDGRSAAIPLPFTFNFYGANYTSMFMGTNGVMGFTGAGFQNNIDAQSVPDPANPDNVIGLFWHDMTMVAAGNIKYGIVGSAPYRKFVISYNNIPNYGAPATNNTGQVILHETTNWIDVIVQSSTGADFRTLGIENLGATEGLAAPGKNATTWTVAAGSPEAYRFAVTNHTYAWTPASNLSNPGISNPQATNLTAPVTYTVNIQNSVTKCYSTGSVAVTVNPVPTASISTSTTTICEGQTGMVDFTGTPNATITYNVNGGAPQTVTLDGSGVYTLTTAPLSTTSNFNIISVMSAQNCSATLTGTATINVNPRPTMTIAGTQTICDGSNGFIQFNPLIGTSPWSVTYTDNNGNFFTESITGSGNIAVTPTTNTTYNITALSDANCASVSGDWSGSATITVNPRPTVSVSTSAPAVCDGANVDLIVTMTGTGPYNFEIYDGINNTPYSGIGTNPFNISVSPTVATTYSVNFIQDANCFGQAQDIGAPVTLNYNTRPTASISGDNTICNGDNTTITLNLTGAGTWTVEYTDGINNGILTGINATPHTFNVAPSTNATYTLVSVIDDNCTAVASGMTGSADITVDQLPVVTTPPADDSRCVGDVAAFTATATGTGISYQWLENGAPISDNAVYSGTATSTLIINELNGLDGNTYQVVVSGTCAPAAISSAATLSVNNTNTWTGTVSTLWSDPANWGCGVLPTQYTNVVISTPVPNMPEVDIATAICNNLTVNAGTNVTFIGTGNALEVKSDITGAGSFDASAGSVILSGNATQSVPGVIYGSLVVDGGSTKNFSGNATITGNLDLLDGYIILGANDLTLGQNATVTNGSAQSFVVTDGTGLVIGENMGTGGNTGTVLFPVGSETTSYTPVSIANTGDMDNINVRIITGVWDIYNGETPNGLQQVDNAVNKTWFINEDVQGGSIATITPQWNLSDELALFDNGNCQVSHYNTTTNEWEPDAYAAAIGSDPFTRTRTGVTTFSPFGVGSTGSPLPLDLISFTGELFQDEVRLTWVTVNEFFMDNFIVERSVNKGKKFEAIAIMPVDGNGQGGSNTYKHTDEDIRKLKVDKVLYRLKVREKNGKYKYSHVVPVNIGSKIAKGMLDVYPNPVTGNTVYVRMTTDNKEDISVAVTDMAGRLISTTNYKAGEYAHDAVPVNINGLAQGMYMLRVTDAQNNTLDVLKFNRQ